MERGGSQRERSHVEENESDVVEVVQDPWGGDRKNDRDGFVGS